MRLVQFITLLSTSTLLMSVSCYEEGPLNVPCVSDCITIEGRLGSENLSAAAVGNASINFKWEMTSPFGGSGRAIATTQTDADGKYRISFQPRANELKTGEFIVEFSKPGYQPMSEYFYDIRRSDTTYSAVTHAARIGGKLRILVIGFPSNPQRDTVRIDNISYRPNEPGKSPALFDSRTGKPTVYANTKATDVYCEVAANQYVFIQLTKKKNGVTTFSRDSIFCPLNQQVTYTYLY